MRHLTAGRSLPFPSLPCLLACLLLAMSCVSRAAADLTQDEAEAVAKRARTVLESMRFGFIEGTLIYHPLDLKNGRPCPNWSLWRASSKDQSKAGVSWSMSVRIFLSPETATTWFGETLVGMGGPTTTFEKFTTTADGVAYAGLNRAEGYRPNAWVRCGNVVLGLGWQKDPVPDPVTATYRDEGLAAAREAAGQIHDAFAAAGICAGAGAGGAGPDQPTVVPPTKPGEPTGPGDKPTVVPPGRPVVTQGRPAIGDPTVQVELDTMRYTPNEVLKGTVEARTGLAEGEGGSGQVTWTVFEDTTGMDLLGMFARGGAPPGRRSTGRGAEWPSTTAPRTVTEPLTTLRLEELLAGAPTELGEYVLVVKLTMDDGQKASASARFDVLDNPRRLILGKIGPDRAVAGRACTISLPVIIGGHDGPGAPPPVARAAGDITGVSDQARGVRETLAEQQPVLAPSERWLSGKASWEFTFPKPGIYVISLQAVAPYYGAKERMTAILVEGGTVAGGSTVTDAGGGRVDANAGTGQTITTTTGGTGTVGETPATSGQTLVPSVGMGIGVKDGEIVILSVDPNGRAALASLQVGDRLTAIGGKPVRGMTPQHIVQMLTPEAAQDIFELELQTAHGKVHAAILADQK